MHEFEGDSADMMSQSEHLSPSDLAGFLDRDLDTSRRRQVEAHLDQCPECRYELAEVARVAASVPAPNGIARHKARRWLPLVLSGALAAGFAGVALLRRSQAPESPAATQPIRAPSLSEGRAWIGIVSPRANATTAARGVAFTWHALAADFYRITLLTESGEPVWTLETPDTSVTLPSKISLVPGRAYFWHVDAVAAGISASTGSHRFQVSP